MPIRKTPLDDAGRKAYTERAQRKARTATTVDELLNDLAKPLHARAQTEEQGEKPAPLSPDSLPFGQYVQVQEIHKLAKLNDRWPGMNMDVMDRRRRVKQRLDEGWSIPMMAADLLVPEHVIREDVQWLQTLASKALTRGIENTRSDALVKLQEAVDAAARDVEDAPTFRDRIAARKLHMEALNNLHDAQGVRKGYAPRDMPVDQMERVRAMLARADNKTPALGQEDKDAF